MRHTCFVVAVKKMVKIGVNLRVIVKLKQGYHFLDCFVYYSADLFSIAITITRPRSLR